MPQTRTTFILPDRYSFDEDTTLRVFLTENAEANIEIAAPNLRRIDSLFIQYLIAAAQSWAAKGLQLEVTGLRTELAQSMELLGVRPEILTWSAAQ
jgi:anti-anti-sigma regulatory factor